MKWVISLILMAAAVSTAQQASPATRPAQDGFEQTAEYRELSERLEQDQRVAAEAAAPIKAGMAQVPKYKALSQKVELAEKRLEEARERGTPEQRVEASGNWNRLRIEQSQMIAAAVEADTKAAEAELVVRIDRQALAAARAAWESQRRKQQAQQQAESQPESRPDAPAQDEAGGGRAESTGDRVQVKGYYRKDGTYVRPHSRSAPRRK